jgi:predicted RNA-binding Zn ribbon-like protein
MVTAMPNTTDLLPEPAQSVDMFVAFANTLGYQRGVLVDDVPDPPTLLDWLRANGLLTDRGRVAEQQRLDRDPAEAERRLERFRFLRELLIAVADRTSAGHGPTRAQVRDLNHVLRHGLHYHRLETEGEGSRYSVSQVGDRLDQARATIASSLAHFLAEDDAARLRVCDNQTCREVFVDRSPTGRRRWCDMRICGNQAKVARHRARAREAAAAGKGPRRTSSAGIDARGS